MSLGVSTTIDGVMVIPIICSRNKPVGPVTRTRMDLLPSAAKKDCFEEM